MTDTGGRGGVVDVALADSEARHLTGLVRLRDPEVSGQRDTLRRREAKRRASAEVRQPLERFVRSRAGIDIHSRFWLVNAAVVEIDRARVSLDDLAGIPGVRRVHENRRFVPTGGTDETGQTRDAEGSAREESAGTEGARDSRPAAHGETTYGLEQINVPAAWDAHETAGEGVRVAVLDTGIDPGHETVDLFTTDPDDPTYPGGWAEWDDHGIRLQFSEPYESDTEGSHGTHVSATVAGGAESERGHVGVAPDVELLHGGVLTDESSGSIAAIIAGLEWVIEREADIVNMSFGPEGGGYLVDIVEILQQTRSFGVLPVSAVGNDGEGYSGSPANVYGAGIAVGATDETEAVAEFEDGGASGGELVVTAEDWAEADPELVEDWPAEYVVPDVVAPGRDIYSARAGNEYGEGEGTSKATPHVTGVAALMVAASEGAIGPRQIQDGLESTAWKPADWDPGDAEWERDGKDSRYGTGIVDAQAAIDALPHESGIEGTVTWDGDSPVAEATVDVADGPTATTDDAGEYTVLLEAGEYSVTTDAFGFAPTTDDAVTVTETAFTDRPFALDPVLDGRVVAGQPETIERGETLTATVEAAHADTVTVTLEGGYDVAAVDLAIDGSEATVGEPVPLDSGLTDVDITVETGPEETGEIALQLALSDDTDTVTVSTGSTSVYEFTVGVIDATDEFQAPVAAVLDDRLDTDFGVVQTETQSVLNSPEDYDTVVVQTLAADDIEDFVTTTADAALGVVYLDQWRDEEFAPNAADAIPQFATASTAVETADQGDQDGGPYYEPSVDHPVFEGFDTDEAILLHEGFFEDYTWVEFAPDQNDFEVLAMVSTDSDGEETIAGGTRGETRTRVARGETRTRVARGETGISGTRGEAHTSVARDGASDSIERLDTGDSPHTAAVGPGIAVDGETRTVLAGSLGRSREVRGEFTDDADEILARAVAHVAEPVLLDLELEIDGAGEQLTIETGTTVDYTATATFSDGSIEVTGDVSVTAADSPHVSVNEETAELTGDEPGGSATVTAAFEYATATVEVGVVEPPTNELTVDAQTAEDGTVSVTVASTMQPSTVVFTYEVSDETVLAGVTSDVYVLDAATVEVAIEDSGGFPGEHTAWLFDTEDLSGALEVGEELTGTDDALAAGTAAIAAGDPGVAATLDAIPVGGHTTVAVDAVNVEQVTIRDLWTDWDIPESHPDDSTPEDRVPTDGEYGFDWGSLQARAEPSITIAPPQETYVGGDYRLTVSAVSAESGEEVSVILTIED